MKELTKEEAIKLSDSKFWENMSYEEIAKFQMNQPCLCIPFSIVHEAIEKTLNRPVYTHEFALNYEGLKKELNGGKAPTFEEIINMISKNKMRIVIGLEQSK
jgi:hypothetical protein